MAAKLVPDIDGRGEHNAKLPDMAFALVEQAGDTMCPPSRVAASLRHALTVDGTGFAWLTAGMGQVWHLTADCSDPELSARLNAIKSPLELAAVRQAIQTGHAVICDAGCAAGETPLLGELAQVRRLAALPVRLTGDSQAVALAFNLKDEPFDEQELRVLKTVCSCLALRLENGYLLQELGGDRLIRGKFDLVKDRVVQRFSHELKTPLAVLIACIKLLQRNSAFRKDPDSQRVLARAGRSAQRLLNMEYELEDILREPD